MVLIKSILEFLAFLQVLFLIYGVSGSYEQEYITGMEYIKYLLLFGFALLVTVLCIKALAAVIRTQNYQFTKSDNNRACEKLNKAYQQNKYTTKQAEKSSDFQKTHENAV